eukprot:m.367439 g.367439  ORF g.367439 m.367439 type:complete len:575 (+) comp20833_c0_seq4:99-1823(+)
MPVTLLLRLRRDVEKRIFSSAVGIMPPPRKTKTSSAKRKPVQNPTRTHVEKKSRQTTSPSDVQPCSLCSFDNLELARVREQLLGWYDEHQRDMPWRHGTYKDGSRKAPPEAFGDNSADARAYAVWVSEMMLQQTQVNTVKSYYKRWMTKWPDVQALAAATLDEVNQVWSGLGYYSRARRLHEGAVKVAKEMGGKFPTTKDELVRHLPGVGPYTGAAVASIAFNEQAGVVDGNVIRVLSRLRALRANCADDTTLKHMWTQANALAACDRPGDLNQALMELGATICTPKAPACGSCPVASECRVHRAVSATATQSKSTFFAPRQVSKSKKRASAAVIPKTEPGSDEHEASLGGSPTASACCLCTRSLDLQTVFLDDDVANGIVLDIEAYPYKPKKTKQKYQHFVVVVPVRSTTTTKEIFITQRPKTGLLAGMWEFPNLDITTKDPPFPTLPNASGATLHTFIAKHSSTFAHDAVSSAMKLASVGDIVASAPEHCGVVEHVFSHLRHTYLVVPLRVPDDTGASSGASQPAANGRWVSPEEFSTAAISTNMRKVYKCFATAQGWQSNPQGTRAGGKKK